MKKTTGVLIALFAATALLLGTLLPTTVNAADKTLIRISAAVSLKDALICPEGNPMKQGPRTWSW